MNLRKTKVYQVIANGSREAILKTMREYLKAGKDPNLRDSETGGNLLHHMIDHASRFVDPEMCSLFYMLACRDVDVDAQDHQGDAPIHRVVRHHGAFRILVALIRCGADMSLRNNAGQTAGDILEKERPQGWEEMLHWYSKYKPGLWCLLQEPQPNRKHVERLLRSWCRLTTVKDGRVTSMKTLVQNDIHKTDILQLMEKYENTIELALALVGGLGFIVRMWIKQGILVNFDVDTADVSYQARFQDCPEVPQPLLAATWEVNTYDAVDALMELHPNTSVLFAPLPNQPPRPLFFHILDSPYRPRENKTIIRILQGSDLSARNAQGQTVLFEAISREEPEEIVNAILNAGVNVASRDMHGMTARDWAARLQRPDYVRMIDSHVLKLIKSKEFLKVEQLILEDYDHLGDIKDKNGLLAVDFAKKHSTRQLVEIVRLQQPIQAYVARVFRAVEENNQSDLQRLLSCKKYAQGRDRCGRTPLLKALMLGHRDLVIHLTLQCPSCVPHADSLGRTTLHYAYLFMDDPEILDLLERHGSSPDSMTVKGSRPVMFGRKMKRPQEHVQLKQEVLDADLDIVAFQMSFEHNFHKAVRNGDLNAVMTLVTELRKHGDVSRYSSTLFDCVDMRREDIAIFLIKNGFRSAIWRQYSQCSPTDPMCAMMECGHAMTSLRERAHDKQCYRVVRAIDDMADAPLNRERTDSGIGMSLSYRL
ncbi:uncharacterized protein LOC143282063 [Babylonia areolata]|uniref:uncharacterized protein LOC143282063 n=1 Tax=Babylonia areolata TaxID=304850 RepID=UPI003FD46D8E